MLTLIILPQNLTVCRLPPTAPPELWVSRLSDSSLWSVTRTADELSLVLESHLLPADFAYPSESGWRALKVQGPLDFGLVGILAKLSTRLAEAGISIFAISTYDTDYILLKATNLAEAVAVLRAGGYRVKD